MGRLVVLLLPLLLAGCLTSKGKFLPTENAATPLPPGKYYRIEFGEPFPVLTGPMTLALKGKEYSVRIRNDIVKFHMIRLVEGKNIYVAQAHPAPSGAPADKSGVPSVPFLFGPADSSGFCDVSEQDGVFPGVSNTGDVTSADELRQWLIGHVDELAKLKKRVCWVTMRPE